MTTSLQESFEFSNDSFNKLPKHNIKFELHTKYDGNVAIYKRTKDDIQQLGVQSLTTRHCWSVAWITPKENRERRRFFTTLTAAKICANEIQKAI